MKVKIARIKAGLTQANLCKLIHMSPNKLVRIERGEYGSLTKNDMEKLAKALETTVQELFFSED